VRLRPSRFFLSPTEHLFFSRFAPETSPEEAESDYRGQTMLFIEEAKAVCSLSGDEGQSDSSSECLEIGS
jgi:hypothetical protein